MFETKLHMVSIGLVAEDKHINNNVIKIYPIELLPSFDGDLSAIEAKVNSSGVDIDDNEYSVTLNVSNFIEAEWLSLSTNRRSAPDVVKGEQVILWSYVEDDKYYWTSMGRDDNLRKLETVTYTFSDIADNGGDIEKGLNNQYTVEISTHGKHITVKTCKNNGEPFAYTFQINAKDGCVFLTDDSSNFITLDSKNTEIKAKNKDNCVISLKRTDIYVSSPNNINVSAGNSYTLKAGGTINIDSGKDMIIKSGASSNISASNIISFKASGISMVSAAGRSTKSGNLSFVGNITINGSTAINGSFSVTGDATFSASVKAPNFYGNFHGTLFGGIA